MTNKQYRIVSKKDKFRILYSWNICPIWFTMTTYSDLPRTFETMEEAQDYIKEDIESNAPWTTVASYNAPVRVKQQEFIQLPASTTGGR